MRLDDKRPYRIDGERLVLQFHDGQWRAWDSKRRIIAVIAGTQGGKTSFGPLWMMREIQTRGPGDYIVAAPTFPLLHLKTIPEYTRLFESILGVASYTGSPVRKLAFTRDGQRRFFGGTGDDYETAIYFGHAQDSDSLESATAKAAHLDECGQKKFRLSSYEAIMRRVSIYVGRLLLTTTPYNLGWLKQQIHDAWRAGDAEIDVIRFRSVDNPAFPRSEYERARERLPRWKFDMFYNAIFTRPAGMIYDNFDEATHVVDDFAIPDTWARYMGQDYGGVHTAAVFLAQDPGNGRFYIYREYLAGQRTAGQHKEAMLAGEPGLPVAYGGAPSEDQWRREFRTAGLPVQRPPIGDVEVGIDRVYGLIAADMLRVFRSCTRTRDEFGSYSRALDDAGNPTEQIEDKHSYHLLDALRYIGSHINRQSDLLDHYRRRVAAAKQEAQHA